MDNTELIERYLDGGLDPESRVAFEKRMSEDAELRDELAFMRGVRAAVVLEERDAIRRMLPPVRRTVSRVWYAAAAAVMLLAGTLVVMQMGAPSAEALYTDYYRTFPNVVAPSVRGEAPANAAGQAFLAYDNGEYDRAELLFTGISAENPAFAFYRAMSLMELERFAEAADVLRGLVAFGPDPNGHPSDPDSTVHPSDPDSTVRPSDPATTYPGFATEGVNIHPDLQIARHWYLGLSLLRMGETGQAIAALERITGETHVLGQQAMELRRQLTSE